MKHQFEKLIRDFCTAAMLPDAQQIMSGAPFDYDGILFGLSYDAKLEPDLMLIYVDFGATSSGIKGHVYHLLLEQNFISAMDTSDAGSGTFGLSSSSGNVVFIKRFDLAGATASKLAKTIARLSQQAQLWRETQFLDEPMPSPTLTSSARASGSFQARMLGLFDQI